MGAGLKSNKERTNERDTSDLWPPDNSDKLSFQTPPKATFTKSPSKKEAPGGGSSLEAAPFSRVAKMEPKSLFTCCIASGLCNCRWPSYLLDCLFKSIVLFLVKLCDKVLDLSLICLNLFFFLKQFFVLLLCSTGVRMV